MSASYSRPGAVDLSAVAARAQRQREAATLGAPPAAAGARAPGAAAPGLVVEVSEQTFDTVVVQQSMTVPVVIDFWAEWCGPCKQLSPILERLATEYGGRFLLATIDIEANKQLAAAAGVQSIPLVLAVVKGQVVPLFNGALPEPQVRQYLDQLLTIAEANGVTGRIETAATDEVVDEPAPDPEPDPRYAAAEAALDRGDAEAAVEEYRKILAVAPADAEAKAGLVQASVFARAFAADEVAVATAAQADPADAAAQVAMADLEVTSGLVDEAFGRLVQAVRLTAGDDRDLARGRLVELFELVGADDPRVGAARRALASALF